MKIKPLQIPKKIERKKEDDFFGSYIISPLEKGFADTLGTALRRVLISSVQGAAITRAKIDGVEHEFDAIPGVLEDVVEIVLNIKQVAIKSDADLPATLELNQKGPKEVYAGDIWVPLGIEIVNKEKKLFSLSKNTEIKIELEVNSGIGYVPSEKLKNKLSPVGSIFLDAIYSPVIKVSYKVEKIRIGNKSDYEKLTLDIHTNGSIKPMEALSHAGKILQDYSQIFINFEKEPEMLQEPEVDEEKKMMKKLLSQKVDELELSVRAANCLNDAEIKNLGELVVKSEQDMLKYKNFGKRSLNELISILEGKGLKFNMDIDDYIDVEEMENKDET